MGMAFILHPAVLKKAICLLFDMVLVLECFLHSEKYLVL